MRILFLTQVLPYPLDAGPKVRAYYVLRHLARAGHRVTLLSFVRAEDQPERIAHLRTFCDQVVAIPMPRNRWRDGLALGRSLISGEPFLITRDRVPAMAEALQRLLREQAFDAIHADQLWMAPYALLTRQPSIVHRPSSIILDQHNAVFQIPRRLAETASNPLARSMLTREARLMARYETHTIRGFDQVVWVTKEDREAVLRNQPSSNGNHPFSSNTKYPIPTPQSPIPNPQSSISHPIIPICIDPDRKQPIARSPSARRVTFLGGLHWPPNAAGVVWFVREVWPLVTKEAPDAILTIIGKNPPKELSNTHDPNIQITGYVPDPAPYLAETAVFIVPLHAGGGMRVKILDAWAWGLPVVSTTIGAEGLRAQPGENILLADDARSFAGAVVEVLHRPALGRRLAEGGRATVESAYDWRKVYRAWDQVYDFTAERAENAERREKFSAFSANSAVKT